MGNLEKLWLPQTTRLSNNELLRIYNQQQITLVAQQLDIRSKTYYFITLLIFISNLWLDGMDFLHWPHRQGYATSLCHMLSSCLYAADLTLVIQCQYEEGCWAQWICPESVQCYISFEVFWDVIVWFTTVRLLLNCHLICSTVPAYLLGCRQSEFVCLQISQFTERTRMEKRESQNKEGAFVLSLLKMLI